MQKALNFEKNQRLIISDDARFKFFQSEISLFSLNTLITVDGSSSTNPQSQTISCKIHLDPADSVVQEQADACSCYTQTECQTPAVPACQSEKKSSENINLY